MRAKAFIDTNILVYLQRTDDKIKQEVASNALNLFDCVVSTQVLNEFCNIFTKKYPVPVSDLEKIVEAVIDACEVSFVALETIKQCLALHKHYQYSFYDCLIIASALESNCEYLFTEDLTDGQVIGNKLKIVNVFNHVTTYTDLA
jgi:predicted nucleic acid-binding protein